MKYGEDCHLVVVARGFVLLAHHLVKRVNKRVNRHGRVGVEV